ncbi:MAG: septal ring lytic transglycosylase RlpA family protein [Bacteroidota bacterium]
MSIYRVKVGLLVRLVFIGITVITINCSLPGCASAPRFTGSRFAQPSVSKGKNVQPPANANKSYEGIASYYADDFHGKKTANGEEFDMHQFTAAHRSFPFGTKVRVTNLDNGKSVIVRVNDRGPFKLERIMDLSYGAAEVLDMIKTGTAHVRLEVVDWGPSDPE